MLSDQAALNWCEYILFVIFIQVFIALIKLGTIFDL